MRSVMLVTLLCAPMALGAQESTASKGQWGWALVGALEMGGDEVATVYFDDGSSQDVKTGQGGTLGVGVDYRPTPTGPWGVRSTIGYKFVTTQARNSDMGVDRLVWDLVLAHQLGEESWVGGGVVRHSNIRFDGGGFLPNMDFDDALGLRLELGWRWIALSYTGMDYTDEFGNDYDASALGLMLTNSFWFTR